jgi:hypothetical protein
MNTDERNRGPFQTEPVDDHNFVRDKRSSENGLKGKGKTWSPRWLRASTIGLFALAIIVPLVAIPVLDAQSAKYNGLTNGWGRALEYVLKFGPVLCKFAMFISYRDQ